VVRSTLRVATAAVKLLQQATSAHQAGPNGTRRRVLAAHGVSTRSASMEVRVRTSASASAPPPPKQAVGSADYDFAFTKVTHIPIRLCLPLFLISICSLYS
jgi:hypothetical protein